jgi:hypothetical protein
MDNCRVLAELRHAPSMARARASLGVSAGTLLLFEVRLGVDSRV